MYIYVYAGSNGSALPICFWQQGGLSPDVPNVSTLG